MASRLIIGGVFILMCLVVGFFIYQKFFIFSHTPSQPTQPTKSVKKVYIVSDEDWHLVFKIIPLAVYYQGDEIKKTPFLIYHKEGKKADFLSIFLFLEKYHPQKLIFFEKPPETLKDKFEKYKIEIKDINKIKREGTIFCDFNNYTSCMYATIYASLYNLSLDYSNNLGEKILFKKGNQTREISLDEIKKEIKEKSKNTILLTNPQDVLEPIKVSCWIESEGKKFSQKIFSQHSLIAPYYALVRKANLVIVNFPIPSEVKNKGSKGWKKEQVLKFIEIAKEKIKKLEIGSNFSTIILGTPFYIPQTIYFSMYHQKEIDSLYGKKVGRIMGYTISDVSAYINRFVFLKPSSKKFVGILQSPVGYYQIRFLKRLKAHLDNFYLYRTTKIFGTEFVIFPVKILEDTKFLIYIGHGDSNGFAFTFTTEDLEKNKISLNGLVLVSSGCLVCDFADISISGVGKESLFCLELLRRGALAQIVGVAGVCPGRSVQVTPYLIEGSSVGEALKKLKHLDPDEKSLVVIGDPQVKVNFGKKISFTKYQNLSSSDCEKLEIEYERDICFSEVAKRKKDFSLCEKIKDIEEKDDCLSTLGGEISEISICEKITLQYEKDYCYFEVGRQKLDPLICEKIENEALNGMCFALIVQKNLDIKICDRAKAKKERDKCRYQVATDTKKEEYCELMETREYKDKCYNTLAFELIKPKLCEKAESEYYKDRCYFNLRIVTGDISWCEKIKYFKEMKEECLSY